MISMPPDVDTLDAVWHVRRAIETLPADEASIVRLQHLDGMTQTEIADKLGLPLWNGQVEIAPCSSETRRLARTSSERVA
jgi:DNA-directed RNA polymerase specialized sigma24 family protein